MTGDLLGLKAYWTKSIWWPPFLQQACSGLAPLIRPVLEGVGPVRRLGLWVLSRRHPDEVELDGQTFKVDPRDFGVTLELHSTGTYEPFTRGLCLESLEPGMVFLDIGAHVGLYSLPASKRVGHQGRVIAFEPHPSNRSLLMENIDRNHVENVTVVPAAVSDEPGQMHLQVSTFNTGIIVSIATLVRSRTSRDGGRVGRQLARIGRHGTVDMIKMDVQGAEANVLAGMRRTHQSAVEDDHRVHPWMLGIGADPIALLTDLRRRVRPRSSTRPRAQSFHHRKGSNLPRAFVRERAAVGEDLMRFDPTMKSSCALERSFDWSRDGWWIVVSIVCLFLSFFLRWSST